MVCYPAMYLTSDRNQKERRKEIRTYFVDLITVVGNRRVKAPSRTPLSAGNGHNDGVFPVRHLT